MHIQDKMTHLYFFQNKTLRNESVNVFTITREKKIIEAYEIEEIFGFSITVFKVIYNIKGLFTIIKAKLQSLKYFAFKFLIRSKTFLSYYF